MTLEIAGEWLAELNEDIVRPAIEPYDVKRTPELQAEFDKIDGIIKAHATLSGEHEAMAYMALYVMWNKSLWRAEHSSWADYCIEISRMPFGISDSTIKHKMSEIRKLLSAGASPETVVKALGKVPTAVTNFINVFVDGKGDNAIFSKQLAEALPAQVTPDEYIRDTLAELGPEEAIAMVDRMAKRPSVWVEDATYNLREQKILFRLVVQDDELGRADTDCVVTNVPEWGKDALLWRLLGRKRYFAAQNRRDDAR
jgi:hypothetical protein